MTVLDTGRAPTPSSFEAFVAPRRQRRLSPLWLPVVALAVSAATALSGWAAAGVVLFVAAAGWAVLSALSSPPARRWRRYRGTRRFVSLVGGVGALPPWTASHRDFRRVRRHVRRRLDPAGVEVFDALAPEWDGTVGTLVDAAGALSR